MGQVESSSSEVGPCETAGDAKTVHALVALADRQAASSSACQTATIQGSNRDAQSSIQHILYQCIYLYMLSSIIYGNTCSGYIMVSNMVSTFLNIF